jgi:hypothetical protein
MSAPDPTPLPPEETFNSDVLECPYCHYKHRDAYEFGQPGEGCGEIECDHCGEEFHWSRTLTIHYTGRPL